jgi:hypothetical protein
MGKRCLLQRYNREFDNRKQVGKPGARDNAAPAPDFWFPFLPSAFW